MPGARWTPSYSLHLDAALQELRLVLRASIAQRTGEDWSGVALTVSTTEPMRWTELPELPALRIGRRQPPPRRTGWREPPRGAEALYADFDRDRQRLLPSPPPQPEPEPEVQVRGAALEREELVAELEDAPAESAPVPRGRATRSVPVPSAVPQAAPAVVMPAPTRAKARSSGLTAMFSAASEAVADLSAADAPAMQAAGGAPPPPPEPPAELTAPDELLDYSRLRLGAADSDRRGQLRPASRLALYQEIVRVEQRIELNRQVLTVVDQASQRARLDRLALPPDHREPTPLHDYDHAWTASSQVDLPSDGGWHTLALLETAGRAQRHYICVPREAPQVFRSVSFDNPMDTPLPAGPVDVFVGGSLLLGTLLRPTDRGGQVRLGLGVEEGLQVARNTRFRERSSGLLGGNLHLEHEIELELANNLGTDARIEVRERVPVTREEDDEVQVGQVHSDPPWQPWEQPEEPVRGAHRWQVDLAPGQRRTLTARYSIQLSGRKELVGGNRRES